MPSVPNISVVILTYNEEKNVSYALDSVKWCDNVVVIDSFSSDRTPAICHSYPNVTFLQHHFDNFALQRQYALESGCIRHNWVLALDADEQVLPELRDELVDISTAYQPGAPVAYDIAMRLIMWERWLQFSSEYPVYWRRFFRLGFGQFVQEGHADKLLVDGPVSKTQADLLHHDHHGISEWLDRHNRYSTREAEYALTELCNVPYRQLIARDRALRRRALKRLFRSLPCSGEIRFLYLYVFRLGFLDGRRGYRYARLKAQQAYFVRLKMEELKKHPQPSLPRQQSTRLQGIASRNRTPGH